MLENITSNNGACSTTKCREKYDKARHQAMFLSRQCAKDDRINSWIYRRNQKTGGHAVTGWSTAPLAAFIFPLIGLFLAPIYPAINSVILSNLPAHKHGSMSGLIVVFSALGGTTGSIITGFIFEKFDRWRLYSRFTDRLYVSADNVVRNNFASRVWALTASRWPTSFLSG